MAGAVCQRGLIRAAVILEHFKAFSVQGPSDDSQVPSYRDLWCFEDAGAQGTMTQAEAPA